MSTPFLDILKYNFSGQLAARLVTFLINAYLIHRVDINLIGLINVRMTLLYTTICFLVREPFRKVCLSNSLKPIDANLYAQLSIPVAFVVFLVCSCLWTLLGSPKVEYDDSYVILTFVFATSALIESLVEPRVIFALKTGENAFFSLAQTVLILLQRVIVFGLMLGSSYSHITCYCVAQMVASIVFATMYLTKFWAISGLSRDRYYTPQYERRYVKLLSSMMMHSFLKQALTDGAGYVMVFTNVLQLEMQGVYDVIERLGSLITRLVLAPLEESAFIFFSSNLSRGGLDSYNTQDQLARVKGTFFGLLRIVVHLGIVVLVFGLPYSSTVVKLYGGNILVEKNGHQMLDLYLVYLMIMAINGITECFAFASMGTNEILSHGWFLFFSFVIHSTLNIVLSTNIGVYGFIVANCINSGLRILFNAHYIQKFLKTSMPSLFCIMPSFKFLSIMCMNSVLIFVSSLIFRSKGDDWLDTGAFIAIGGVQFFCVLVYLYQTERLFLLTEKLD